MFGLEGQKKKKAKGETFAFDLEKDLREVSKQKEIKQHVEGRIQQIKQILKKGESRQEFDQLGVLLHGYTALQKVTARCMKEKGN